MRLYGDFIREKVLREIVLKRIFAVTAMFYEDITAFMELITETAVR